MKYELVIYAGGTAILADHKGNTVWTSDDDEDFMEEFDAVTFDDADAIAEYLEDSGYLPEDCPLDIVESDDTGLHELDVHAFDADDYEDEDEDEDDA